MLCCCFHGRSPTPTPTITKVCPGDRVQARGADFQPGGIILTAFDKSAIWVYNVDNGRRYPLPDTAPCTSQLPPVARCDLADLLQRPDQYLQHHAARRHAARAGRRKTPPKSRGGIATTYLVWTPGKQAYLQSTGGGDREYLNVDGVISVQPGGRYGVLVEPKDDGFERWLVNLELRGLDGISDDRSIWARIKPISMRRRGRRMAVAGLRRACRRSGAAQSAAKFSPSSRATARRLSGRT